MWAKSNQAGDIFHYRFERLKVVLLSCKIILLPGQAKNALDSILVFLFATSEYKEMQNQLETVSETISAKKSLNLY